MSVRRSRLMTAIALAGLLTVAGCASSSSDSASNGSAGGGTKAPIKIFSILPDTGPASAFGSLMERGVETAVATINAGGGMDGRKIQLTKLDDQSSAQQAVAQARQAITSGADAIVGSGVTADCYAMLPVVDQSKTLTYCLSGAPVPSNDKFMLFALPDTSAFISHVGDWMNSHGYKKLAILAGSDASGQVISKALQQALPSQGITITGTQTIDPTAASATAQLTKLQAGHPDVLYSVTTGDGLTATVLRGMAGQDFNVPVITGWNNASVSFQQTIAKVVPSAGLFVPGLTIYTTKSTDKGSLGTFVAAYQKKFPGAAPDMFSASGWDAVHILAKAVAKAGTGQSALNYVTGPLGAFDGATGTIQFGPGKLRGTSASGVTLLRVTASGFEKAN